MAARWTEADPLEFINSEANAKVYLSILSLGLKAPSAVI
jgi:hypothetical protein